jgi:hypothetical protein
VCSSDGAAWLPGVTDEPRLPPDGGEDGLSRLVAALPLDRRNAVLAFVTERVATCPYCGTDVRRDSARGLDADEQLGCLQAMRRTRLRRFFDTDAFFRATPTAEDW